MKNIALLFSAILLLATMGETSAAADNDLCICLTGTSPSGQVEFFKAGCKLWNMGQSCKKKITVSEADSLEDILKANPQAKSLNIGYVGHWSSAHASRNFLKYSIVPLIRAHDVTVNVDNTACLATNNPYIILNYLKTLDVADKINFRGNQAISTGMWDGLLAGKNNFWANINGKNLEVTFPLCSTFEGQGCMGVVQDGGTGVCHDEKDDSHRFLKCEEGHRWITRSDGKRATRVKEKSYTWKPLEIELKLEQGYNRTLVKSMTDMMVYKSFQNQHDAEAFKATADQDVRVILMENAR